MPQPVPPSLFISPHKYCLLWFGVRVWILNLVWRENSCYNIFLSLTRYFEFLVNRNNNKQFQFKIMERDGVKVILVHILGKKIEAVIILV